jgi:23S rRNA A2030 N6-methylase RlmJ
VINNVILTKKDRKLDFIFHSEHCKFSKKYMRGAKDLNILWEKYKLDGYRKNNTILIDDLPELYSFQKKNCILIKPFYFNDEKSELDKVLDTIKEKLERTKLRYEKNNS